MRTLVICGTQCRRYAPKMLFYPITPPLTSATPKRGTKGGFVLRCISYMSYSKYTTDICLNSDAPKHLTVSYQIPPPLYFPYRDSNHGCGQKEIRLYLYTYIYMSYSTIATASNTFALTHLDNPHKTRRWYAGVSWIYPPQSALYVFSLYPYYIIFCYRSDGVRELPMTEFYYLPCHFIPPPTAACGDPYGVRGILRRYVFNYNHRLYSLSINGTYPPLSP